MWKKWWLRCHTQSPMSGFSHSSANQVSSSSESWELNKNNRNGIQCYCNLCKKFNGILIYRVASGISNIIDYKLTMSRIISLHHILFLEVTSWISEQLGNNPWNGISLVLLLSLDPTMLLMDPDPWEVDWVSWWEQWLERGRRVDDWSGRSDTLVGGRTVARKLSSPLTPSPCSPNRTPHFKLSHSRSRISRISHSPPWNFLTSTLSCSVAFNHFWAQVQLSCVLARNNGAFLWTARCSLFALCSPSNPSFPPYLSHSALSLPTFSLSRELFVLHCKLFLHLNFSFALSGTFAFKFYPHCCWKWDW